MGVYAGFSFCRSSFTTDNDVRDHEPRGNQNAKGLQDALQVEALSHDVVDAERKKGRMRM